ncbi:MAG: hypothetical protein JSR61_18980 [Proteobacteria bacterium]|nr:hypothetical protein [Pseudomonadota bacterium]
MDAPPPSNDNAQRSLFVATPCFGGMVATGYMSSILKLMQAAQQHDVAVSINMLGRDSLVTRARNTLTAHFLASEATHLMFIDADLTFEPELVLRMLAFDQDLVGGMYPAKAINWQPPAHIASREPMQAATLQYVGKFCEGDELERRGPFATGVYCATGFMMIKRQAIERLVEAYPERAYASDHVYSPDRGGRPYYALFECMIDPKTREYLSEDFGFCHLWRSLGGQVWLDVEGALTHTGPHDFHGMPALRFGSSQPARSAAVGGAR